MVSEAAVVTKLKTNALLLALMTGGILSAQDDLGGLGFSRATYPAAWNGLTLLPTLVVKIIRDQSTQEFGDEDLQIQPTRAVLKAEFFNDRGSAHITLRTGADYVYKTLQARPAGSYHWLYQDVDPSLRVKDIDWAYAIVETYFGRGVRRPV